MIFKDNSVVTGFQGFESGAKKKRTSHAATWNMAAWNDPLIP
jgi:hypothetical protein